ncbi:MAG: phosphonate metabolism protein/1,5-bisphosphokinase (PRPP-forming) PhnN [Pseudomonadota bacterium]
MVEGDAATGGATGEATGAATSSGPMGRLVLVVGPSGAGKDTLLDLARAALANRQGIHFARRAITRPADAGGEAHEAITEAAFEAGVAAGRFFAHWRAHGLGYGLPAEIGARLAQGETVVVNASRAALAEIAARYARTEVVIIDAPLALRAERLAARGREDAADIARRQARQAPLPPEGLAVTTVMNDATPEKGAARLVAVLADHGV